MLISKKTVFILTLLFLLTSFVLFNIKTVISFALFPDKPFDHSLPPAQPNYQQDIFWASLPTRQDSADIVPPGSSIDRQVTARADVFFIHPTSFFLSRQWNAEADNWLASFITDNGIIPMMASAFNGVGKVYAPRYRQASQGAQMQTAFPKDSRKALAIARHDVIKAFDHFLDQRNHGRPFIIASHSQGTTHAVPLLQHLFNKRPDASRRLIAAYLIGNTVQEKDLDPYLPVCQHAEQTGCYLSWNSILEGGDGSHWQNKGDPVCVNPLSWQQDSQTMNAEKHLGAIGMGSAYGLPQPNTQMISARCEQGILWISQPDKPGYDDNVLPGGGYHAYDYNLFYMDIRHNAAQRVAAFLESNQHNIRK